MHLPHRIAFVLIAVGVGGGAFIGSQFTSSELIRLPLLTIGIASAIFVLFVSAESKNQPVQEIKYPKYINIIVFIAIAITTITGQIGGEGIVDWYYLFAILTSGLLAFRFISTPVQVPIQLIQILLFSLTVRATVWFSFPIYGQDLFHQASTAYIISTGEIVPETFTYYANFPHAHVFAASSTLITGSPLKVGYFTLGISIVTGILSVYLLGKHILESRRGGLLAALFISVAAFHIKSAGEPFAQALFTALFPIIVYLLLQQITDRRHSVVLIFLIIFAVTIQNLAPLILASLFAILFISNLFIHFLTFFNINTKDKFSLINERLVFVSLVVGVYYYIIADYLRFQSMRIFWIYEELLGFQSSGAQSSVNNTGVTGIPNITLFNYDLPGLLLWAGPILVIAGLLILSGYVLCSISFNNNQKKEPVQYIFFSGGFFTFFALTFTSIGGPARRAMAAGSVLIAPVAAWIIYKTVDRTFFLGKILPIMLVVTVCISGIFMPSVAKAELSEDEFQPYMRSNQVAASEFAFIHTNNVTTGSYVLGYEEIWQAKHGNISGDKKVQAILNKHNPESIDSFRDGLVNGKTTMYFNYYNKAYNIQIPTTNRIYSSGNTTIHT
ncbi:hypothetical protein [Halobellus captivus]|uniref:hypothetical protein n=1 Tax=Halobellus captivus TaxID=2592614 RepID=UPI0011A07DEA|nr:hypothetical protein [Halobellus captivus]